VHAARRHPIEYPHCLPHLAKVICDPLYIGDDHENPGKIEPVGRIPTVNSFVLVAIEVTKDKHGRYSVRSFYTVSKEKVDGRRHRGFLKIAVKAKGPL
jgi:hypothetical protein